MAGEAVLNNRYELVAQQGSGGMAVVYKAFDRLLGRNVAVKILRPSLQQNPTFLERFKQEALILANLVHPNIITVQDVGSDGPTHYIVMELIEGEDLKRIIKAQGALSVDRVLDISIQIASGIGYAHRSGLVHAQLTPQNILIDINKAVKLIDFGAQALYGIKHQHSEMVWASPSYYAPEQARGEPPGPGADVYSTGIVMFEMLTGRLPYSGTSQQDLAIAHIQSPIPAATDFNPTVPESLSKLVQRLMSKQPSQRYQTGSQLEQVLTQLRNQSREYTMRNPLPPAAPRLQDISSPSMPSRYQPPLPPPPIQQNQPPVSFSMPARDQPSLHPLSIQQDRQNQPPESRPVKLFISYRSLDSAKVDTLAARLASLMFPDGKARYMTWQDKHNIIAGRDWWDSIIDAIIACDVFVFHISEESLKSDVCRAELNYAYMCNCPIIAIVLQGEADFNGVTSKYELSKRGVPYGPNIPSELNELRSQFIFYEGGDFFKRFNDAIQNFVQNPKPRIKVLPPLDPSNGGLRTIDEMYQEACDYAGRLALDNAEKLFRRLMNHNHPDYGTVCYEWIEILHQYKRLIEIDEKFAIRFMLKSKWEAYKTLFPKPFLDGIFDPKGFAAKFVP